MTGKDTLAVILCRMVDEIPEGEPITGRVRVYVDNAVVDTLWFDPAAGMNLTDTLTASARQAKVIEAHRAAGADVMVEYWFPGLPAAHSALRFDGTNIAAMVPPTGLGGG